MTSGEKQWATRSLQTAVDLLWSGLPEPVRVSIVGDRIWCRYRGWTSALFRHGIEDDIHLDDATRPYNDDQPWCDIALPIMQSFLGERVSQQRELHARAQAFGLVIDGQCHDLPIDRWLIDASLAELLWASGFNIRDVAAAIVTAPFDYFAYGSGQSIWMPWADNTVIVAPGAGGMPVISTLAEVGRGLLDDRSLEMPDILPDVVMDAASGRRLGEIVATGFDHLDARRIESIVRYKPPMGGWRHESRTPIQLEPDYVPLRELWVGEADR